MLINNVPNTTNAQKTTFNARLIRNLSAAHKPEVKRVMTVAQDFFEKTAKKYPDLELRMYQDPSFDTSHMSLFKIKDRAMCQGKGVISVETLIEDNPTDAKLVTRLKKLLSYLKKESDLMKLSDDEIAQGKGAPFVEQMKKIAGKDKVLLNDAEFVGVSLGVK